MNPHINLFFFNSRGTVGRPVTHRKGRGWRGGFLGSAIEQYIKLDLNKWLKVLRYLELLPRPMGQDWSEVWLQKFDGTVTIWPKTVPSDFYYILSDPSPERLDRMLREGQRSTFGKIPFIKNRHKIEGEIMNLGLVSYSQSRSQQHPSSSLAQQPTSSASLTGPFSATTTTANPRLRVRSPLLSRRYTPFTTKNHYQNHHDSGHGNGYGYTGDNDVSVAVPEEHIVEHHNPHIHAFPNRFPYQTHPYEEVPEYTIPNNSDGDSNNDNHGNWKSVSDSQLDEHSHYHSHFHANSHENSNPRSHSPSFGSRRRGFVRELRRQSAVLFDDSDTFKEEDGDGDGDAYGEGENGGIME